MGTITDLLGYFVTYAEAFIRSLGLAFRFIFSEFPPLFGLSLGWWLLIFAVFSVLISILLSTAGGGDD